MDKYSTMTLVLSLLMTSAHPAAPGGDGYHRFHCDPGACPAQHAGVMPKPQTRKSNVCRAEKPADASQGG